MKQGQTNIIIADNKIAKVVVRFRNLQPNLPVYSQHVYITNPIILIHVLIYRTHTLKTKKKKKKKNLQVSLSQIYFATTFTHKKLNIFFHLSFWQWPDILFKESSFLSS